MLNIYFFTIHQCTEIAEIDSCIVFKLHRILFNFIKIYQIELQLQRLFELIRIYNKDQSHLFPKKRIRRNIYNDVFIVVY